jgi:TonB family protein
MFTHQILGGSMSLRYVTAVLVYLGLVGVLVFTRSVAQEKVDVKSMPKIRTTVQPVYPEEAKKGGIEGMVLVNALVDASGKVVEAEIAKSDASVLDNAALDAIRRWTFAPAVSKEDKQIGVWVTIPVKFKLAEKEEKSGDK